MNLPHPTRADLLLIIPWIVGALVLFFGGLLGLLNIALAVSPLVVDPAAMEPVALPSILVLGGAIGGFLGARIYDWRHDDGE